MKSIKKRCYEVMSTAENGDTTSRIFDIFIMTLIVVNVIVFVFSTEKSISKYHEEFFFYFELISVLIFTVEYVLRLWSINEDSRYRASIKGRIKFIFAPMTIIDLLAILPFYISFGSVNLLGLMVLRLFRVLRLIKIGRYYNSLTIIKNVLKNKKEELILTSVIFIFLLFISATLMYYAEYDAQPDVFSSIPESMWWAVITLTTVGYGDVYPITVLGKIIACVIAIAGIGMFALPTGIIGAGFIEEIEKRKNPTEDKKICPNCKIEIE